jgi:hypothetical protein
MKDLEPQLEETLAYLRSAGARDSLARDPYWPKWDSPWWRMTLLWELGLASEIPRSITEAMVERVDVHYVHYFPTRPGQLPTDKDPRLHVLCQCAVGTLHQVLTACGVAVDRALPWLKRLLLDTQLPDGGLNCDDAAYTGSRKSSVVSTLPALEAVLRAPGKKTAEEVSFLDRGAAYLIGRKLVRSSTGKVIDPDWLKPCFPRFYHYDVLRGAAFLREWSALGGKAVPREAVADAALAAEHRWALEPVSLVLEGAVWKRGASKTFPLLEAVKSRRLFPGTNSGT